MVIYASDAVASGVRRPYMERVARIGMGRSASTSCHKRLKSMFKKDDTKGFVHEIPKPCITHMAFPHEALPLVLDDLLQMFCDLVHLLSCGCESRTGWGMGWDGAVLVQEMFHFLWTNYRPQFRRHFGTNPDAVSKFWEDFRKQPLGEKFVANHPHLSCQRDWSRTVPIILHADRVPVTKKKSAMVSSRGATLWYAVGA